MLWNLTILINEKYPKYRQFGTFGVVTVQTPVDLLRRNVVTGKVIVILYEKLSSSQRIACLTVLVYLLHPELVDVRYLHTGVTESFF